MREGRPSIYTKDLADLICERLAAGESMRSISRDPDMPAMSTLFKWIREKEEFSAQYDRAKIESADALVEDMLDIADNATNDWMEHHDPDNSGYKLNGEHIQRSKLRVDVRKWSASKQNQKKYGDRVMQEHTGPGGGPIVAISSEMTAEEAARIYNSNIDKDRN